MNRQEKEQIVSQMHEDFLSVQGAVLADYHGLSVKEITEIRQDFRKAGVVLKVIKNRLAQLAVKDTPLEVLKDDFRGPTAIVYSLEDPLVPAKLAVEWGKKQEKFKIKCGYIDKTRLNIEDVNQLAKLPSLDELRGKLLGTLLAPATQFVSICNAVPQKFVQVLAAYKEKLEKGEE